MSESCEHRRRRGGWTEDRALGRCAWPIGPRNTWSNLAYPAVGWSVLALDPASAMAWVFAGAMTVLGIGSALYHGFKTIWANQLDHVGMYLVFGSLLVAAMAPEHPYAPLAMAVSGLVLAVIFAYVVKVSLDAVMGVLLWFTYVGVALEGDMLLGGISLALFTVGYTAWQLDKAKHPMIGLWGHAVWHILTAAALGAMFLALTP